MMVLVQVARVPGSVFPSHIKHTYTEALHGDLVLSLAEGSTWIVVPGDEFAALVVARLAEIMGLMPIHSPDGLHSPGPDSYPSSAVRVGQSGTITHSSRLFYQLHISVERVQPSGGISDVLSIHYLADSENQANVEESELRWDSPSINSCSTIICHLSPAQDDNTIPIQLQRLSLLIAQEAERRGGLLLHGALSEWHGQGVILAGPGCVGKSTASSRLPSPWRSLCDDMTLVVKDSHDVYWAHPWPTWSAIIFGDDAGSWNVQQAVPLKEIFFLSQDQEDLVDPLRPVDAACLLNEAAEQASKPALLPMKPTAAREHRLQRLDSACALAKHIPVFHLHISRTGEFWHKIEETLVGNSEVPF